MENVFLETERLILKKMSDDDFDDLAQMLKDPDVMYAWEHKFSDEEVYDWIHKNISFYEQYGYSYFLAFDKKSDKVIGQIGILQDNIRGVEYTEVGYILKKEFWGLGYAYEGAKALIEYAFEHLNAELVIAEIRPNNLRSRSVAERLGMEIFDEFNKNVRGKMMLHLMYGIKNPAI